MRIFIVSIFPIGRVVSLIPISTFSLTHAHTDVGTVSAVKKEDIVQKSIFRKDEEGRTKCGLILGILPSFYSCMLIFGVGLLLQ